MLTLNTPLSIMINPYRRAIREAQAKRLRAERSAQTVSGVAVVLALLAVGVMLWLGPP